MSQEIAAYIAANRGSHSRDAIDGQLRSAGYDQSQIDAAWRDTDGPSAAPDVAPPAAAAQTSTTTEVDKQEQLDQITPWVLPSESLYAVYDCKGAGTGFVAITNKRLIFYDKAPMRKRKALVSVPFNKVTAVSTVDQGRGLFGATSELVIKTGSEEYDFEFRGGDKAHRAYRLIMNEILQSEP